MFEVESLSVSKGRVAAATSSRQARGFHPDKSVGPITVIEVKKNLDGF